jgi:hypothetical protein
VSLNRFDASATCSIPTFVPKLRVHRGEGIDFRQQAGDSEIARPMAHGCYRRKVVDSGDPPAGCHKWIGALSCSVLAKGNGLRCAASRRLDQLYLIEYSTELLTPPAVTLAAVDTYCT